MGGARPQSASPKHRAARGTALALAIGTALLASCTRTQPTDQHYPASSATPSAAAAQDVCARFAVMALSVDTTIDHSPADARHRAADQFGTSALDGQLTGQGSDATWPTLVARHAHVVVTTTPDDDDVPPATGTQTAAGVIAVPVAVGSDGWRQPLPADVVFCTLNQTSAGWKVAAVAVSDTGASAVSPPIGGP